MQLQSFPLVRLWSDLPAIKPQNPIQHLLFFFLIYQYRNVGSRFVRIFLHGPPPFLKAKMQNPKEVLISSAPNYFPLELYHTALRDAKFHSPLCTPNIYGLSQNNFRVTRP